MSNFWNSVIHPLLEFVKPKNILQIGSKTQFNHNLLNFSIKNKSMVDIFEDSDYELDLGNYRNMYGNIFEIYIHTPFEKLISLNKYEVIFIDGNRSFTEISNYLNLIFKYYSFTDFPIIIFFNISQVYEEYDGNSFNFYKFDYKSSFKNNNIKSSIFDSIYEIINTYKEFSFFYTSLYNGLSILFLDKYYTDIELKDELNNSLFFDFFENFNNLENINIIPDNINQSDDLLFENFPLNYYGDFFINDGDEISDIQNLFPNSFFLNVYQKALFFKNKLFNNFNHTKSIPLVSILIINDGYMDLKKLFDNFDLRISYPHYELLILNKEFSDDLVDYLKSLDLPIKLIDYCGDSSSMNKNHMVSHANGEYLCFFNGNIFPNDGWLDELMDIYLSKDNVGIVGSSILVNEFNFESTSIFHEIKIMPFNFKEDSFFNSFKKIEDYIVSAFLVNKDKFFEVGGFSTEYSGGIEDVDLALKFIKKGYFNHKSSKSIFEYSESISTDYINHTQIVKNDGKDIFIKNWKLFLKKILFLDKFYGFNFYIKEKFKILFIVPYYFLSTFKYSSFLEFVSNNWDYEIIYDKNDFFENRLYDVESIDMLISFTPHYDFTKLNCNNMIKIYWFIDDEPLNNINDSDIIIVSNVEDKNSLLETYATNAFIIDKDIFSQNITFDSMKLNFKFFKDIIIDYISKIKILIKIGSPNWVDIKNWGDYHFALSLKKELENLGCLVIIQVLSEWDNSNGLYDVVLVLRGLSVYNTQQEHFNIMWNISHPDAISTAEYESYDQIFVASDFWAKKIGKELSVPVSPLLQCTDENLFFKEFDEDYKHDLLFVGNSRLVYRKILKDLDLEELNKKGIDLGIYGGDWEEFIPKKYINGVYISNRELHKVYASSKILLNDHWEDMAKLGFISNRIFDGFASGTFLLSDYVNGIENVFGESVVTYSDKNELNNLIELYLNNIDLRTEKINMGKNIVLEHHTFKQRAKFLFNFIKGYL